MTSTSPTKPLTMLDTNVLVDALDIIGFNQS
jgi:hypothetical protein